MFYLTRCGGAACRCECSAGFAELPLEDNTTECVDRNECIEFSTLCKRNANTRNVCRNTEGSFECLFDTENECTAANSFNQCWQDTIFGTTVTSCEVRTHMHACNKFHILRL